METIFIYLIKSSAIISIFYMVYYFLLRNDTFFNYNRLFLLIGFFTATFLPLLTIKKTQITENSNFSDDQILTVAKVLNSNLNENYSTNIDWISICFLIYIGITFIISMKIIAAIFHIINILKTKQYQHINGFKYIDSDDIDAPFSFYNFIVFNSKLYSKSELQNILEHEKVHSLQHHSLDVLIANLFSAVFWFNPIIYFYKKSIIQNLEFIADNGAISKIEDKTRYQMTLLKVVSYQNYFPITNHFYQSLIKKRIIMLNKNLSKKQNLFKFAVIIPVLIFFVMLFQVKVVAQTKYFKEIKNADGSTTVASAIIAELEYTKNSTNKEMQSDANILKKDQNVDLKFSKIKRNSKGEITAIAFKFDDHKGSTGTTETNSTEPIKPIKFVSKRYANGKIEIGFYKPFQVSSKPPKVPKAPKSTFQVVPPAPPLKK